VDHEMYKVGFVNYFNTFSRKLPCIVRWQSLYSWKNDRGKSPSRMINVLEVQWLLGKRTRLVLVWLVSHKIDN